MIILRNKNFTEFFIGTKTKYEYNNNTPTTKYSKGIHINGESIKTKIGKMIKKLVKRNK